MRSRVTLQQGVPGDADAVWGTVCPGRGAGDPASLPDTFGALDGKPIEASLWQATWHPQGPPTSTQPPRATTHEVTTPPQTTARRATRVGRGAVGNVVARGGGVGRMGPCGCQA